MVNRLFTLALVILLSGMSFASESSVLAFRAQSSIAKGKFAKGYSQLERALLASRKEADLGAEGRILNSMAKVRIMSLDLNFADSLLSAVRQEAMDNNTKLMFNINKISLANAREKFNEGEKICRAINESDIKKCDESLKAALYSSCAISYAGTKQEDDAKQALKMTAKNSDDDEGFYAYTAANVSRLLGNSDAETFYKAAEEKSIKSNFSYMTATILWERSLLKGVSQKEKADLRLRCKNAFELMGLPNNAKRCGE
jgi:hypothetical protein